MIAITETKTHIILNHSGCEVSRVLKSDVVDFTTGTIGHNGLINFEGEKGSLVYFALPLGEQFDTALNKLIKITDGMKI